MLVDPSCTTMGQNKTRLLPSVLRPPEGQIHEQKASSHYKSMFKHIYINAYCSYNLHIDNKIFPFNFFSFFLRFTAESCSKTQDVTYLNGFSWEV